MADQNLHKFFSFSPASIWPKTSQGTPSPSLKGRKRPRKASTSQTVIDAGQSKIGLHYCSECGMTYNVDNESDRKMHDEYHNRYTSTKPFQIRSTQVETWKKHVKHVLLDKPMVGTLFVLNRDTKYKSIRKKVDELIQDFVNPELGFCNDVSTWKAKRLVLVLVVDFEDSDEKYKFISGIALADPVEKVRLLPDDAVMKLGKYVGINRLWIHQAMRRKGLATLLTNAARPLVYPDVPLADTRAAFYEPSGDSLKFVLAYFGQQNGRYLTYDDE